MKDAPYSVNENSAEKAAKVFLENCRSLNLLVNNQLRYSHPEGNGQHSSTPPKPPVEKLSDPNDQLLFELPIPLPGNRLAFLKYDRNKLKKRDIEVIKKALDFVESSIWTDEDEEKKE